MAILGCESCGTLYPSEDGECYVCVFARHERMAEAMARAAGHNWHDARLTSGGEIVVGWRDYWRNLARAADEARGD